MLSYISLTFWALKKLRSDPTSSNPKFLDRENSSGATCKTTLKIIFFKVATELTARGCAKPANLK